LKNIALQILKNWKILSALDDVCPAIAGRKISLPSSPYRRNGILPTLKTALPISKLV
jgi:hypothetical protein